MRIRQSYLKALAPYFAGEQPRDNGEIDLYCPLHEDATRSNSLNVKTGDWWCFAGCGGGRISELIARKAEWVDPPAAAIRSNGGSHKPKTSEPEVVTEKMIAEYSSNLQNNADESLDWMSGFRGLEKEILKKYQIGWDPSRRVYVIPVRGASGTLAALRRYNPHPSEGRRKMWGARGLNAAHLYPLDQLSGDELVVCGGEWDVLATIQAGFPAITRTAAEIVWRSEWNKLFKDKVVYVCHDMDHAGQAANRKVVRALKAFAADVRTVMLPFTITEKGGKDLSDYWMKYDADHFRALLGASVNLEPMPQELETITVPESFDSNRVSQPVQMILTIKGRKEPGYSVPREAALTCTQNAGEKCNYCPLFAKDGSDKYIIEPSNPAVMEMMEATTKQLDDIVRRAYGAPACSKLQLEMKGHQAVELLYARPSIDHYDGSIGDYKNIKITSVGKHNTSANSTVVAQGALYPNPRSQVNEFQSWDVQPVSTIVDNFSASSEELGQLTRFQPDANQSPVSKLEQIAISMADNVTKIYGRPEMHMLMDVVWHSPLEFCFRDEVITRGWVEGLVLGDTRTGKSEAAARLARYYQAGELVNCEAASFAGVVGGLQQFGSGREWAVTWGAIPLNDRRLVVLDEVSGLSPEAISQMSDIRSSGVAKITKIQSEVTFARTRLLWLSNPRAARMGDFTWGVQAIRPLIGNNEDIARFDLVCAVSVNDVPAKEINRPHRSPSIPFSPESCATLVRWAWTRKRDQISWAKGAEGAVYAAALRIGRSYVESPPLLQAANARVKIARIAIAIAMRLFSSPDGEVVVVTQHHVEAAVQLIDRLYQMPTMGYSQLSQESITNAAEANEKIDKSRTYIRRNAELTKFIRSGSSFRRQDLEEVLNISREDANSILNTLWDLRLIRKEGGNVLVEPVFHSLLREPPS